jgi:hypothetical protein
MMYKAEDTLRSEIHTKHTNVVLSECSVSTLNLVVRKITTGRIWSCRYVKTQLNVTYLLC